MDMSYSMSVMLFIDEAMCAVLKHHAAQGQEKLKS